MGIQIVNKVDNVEIHIVGDILDDSYKGIWLDDENTYPSDVRNALKDADGKALNVHVNSGGGDLFAGIAISNMIRSYKGNTTTYVDGLAGSSASIIAFGADKIVMPKNSFLMIHKPSTWVGGTSKDMRKMADTLDKLQGGILETYTNHMAEGVNKEVINNMIDEETWLNGEEASKYFNIDVVDSKEIVNHSDLSSFKNVPKALLNLTKDEECAILDDKKVVLDNMRKEVISIINETQIKINR